jgi:3-oxoacyl-[acyl-carrier protein] reductase
MNLGLDGKACIVTGASSGIGAATVRMLEEEGARVLGVARRGDFAVDVTEPDAATRIVAECEQRFRAIDVLVNCAGTSRMASLDELTDDDWAEQWALNVMAPMRLMQAAAPRMAERGGGRIVNVASSSGKRPSARNAAYSVTKAAELSLSRVYADEWAPKGVLVNAVAPGPIASPLWTAPGGMAEQAGPTPEEALRAAGAKIPIGRLGTEDEVAAVIVFLCSALASNVAGAAWSVDGGSVPFAI